jgi:DNA-binding transcriptional MerR regulator
LACLTCADALRGPIQGVSLPNRLLQCHTFAMARERVYQAASRYNVSSRRLLVYLDSHDLPHSTASSGLSLAAVALLSRATTSEILTDSARHHRPRFARRPVFWSWEREDDDWGWGERVWWRWEGPDHLTTEEAAWAYDVRPATIRQWVRRGYLAPVGRRGRSSVFSARDVYRAALATGDRNAQPGGPLARETRERAPAARYVSGQAMATLVTAEAAGSAVGVSASTIRSWAHRGILTPAQRQGRTPLYTLASVVRAARRSPHRPPRRERPAF